MKKRRVHYMHMLKHRMKSLEGIEGLIPSFFTQI